jgi:hypothetical protein
MRCALGKSELRFCVSKVMLWFVKRPFVAVANVRGIDNLIGIVLNKGFIFRVN